MEREIRIPQQKRSAEKKTKIIEAAYKIFNEKGYFNTNTAEIAKEAGIATGSLYSYYKDKKDIFIVTIEKYSEEITKVVKEYFEEELTEENLFETCVRVINALMEAHKISSKLHQEMTALSQLDSDVKEYFNKQQKKEVEEVIELLEKKNIKVLNKQESGFFIISLAESLCHELTYNENTLLHRDTAIRECALIISEIILKHNNC